MDAARSVGLHLRQRRSGVDWAVPDEAEPPASGRDVVKGARHGIAEDVLAIEEAPPKRWKMAACVEGVSAASSTMPRQPM